MSSLSLTPAGATSLWAAAKDIRQMTPAERKMIGIYKGQDEMTVAEIIEVFIVAHAENHLAQLRAALGT